ncbi:MAG: serine/threonine protein kinase [Planctomycetes bacterium]|nr:serine/threonine protein kinase [Planctomycetota bacterium]
MTWTRERWARIEEVFHRVAEAGADRRPAELAAACAGDPELRREVARLLDADEPAADGVLDTGIGVALHGHDPLIGRRVGAFELVERIAEGGMGTVYRAERRGADFRQEAAVKVLRLGLSTPAMRERFVRERQVLARLVHPNVARLHDGGVADDGLPYIAMELVSGLPIDRYCDQLRTTVRGRLELFVAVCRAVDHAHRNLILHLDLKPSNVLVDENGAPKLVDFGVAALLQDVAAGADAAVAVTRNRPLTPEYASPELLRGEPVGVAADVWSLGAVLYELLTGSRAFRPTGSDIETARAVCETDAARPSAAFGDGKDAVARAAARSATPGELVRALRGDLDRIVQKAMRKEISRRYASCAALADDVERYLGGFPVLARDPSLGYRASKFIGRNRLGVAAAFTVLVALVGGLAATLRMAAVARDERDAAALARREAESARDRATAASVRAAAETAHARIEAASSQEVAEFLGDTFLSSQFLVDPAERDAAVAMIRRRAEQVRQRALDPHLGANLLHALGRSLVRVGAFSEAENLLKEAAAIRREHFGPGSLENALSLGALGRMWFTTGRLDEAATALREAYALHRDRPHDVHTDLALAANDLAAVERALGNVVRARDLHREALALRRESGEPVLVAESLNNLANAESDPAVVRQLLEEALALRENVLGPDDPLTIQSRTNLAAARMQQGGYAEARPLLTLAIAKGRSLGALGAEGLGVALRLAAVCDLQLGDAAAAEAQIEESLALDRQRLGEDNVRLATPLEIRARIREGRGRWGEAALDWRDVLRFRTTMLPRQHRSLPLTRCSLGTALVRAGDVDAGLAEVRAANEAITDSDASVGDRLDASLHLALAEEAAGNVETAERLLRDAARRCDETPEAKGRREAFANHLRTFLARHPSSGTGR